MFISGEINVGLTEDRDTKSFFHFPVTDIQESLIENRNINIEQEIKISYLLLSKLVCMTLDFFHFK